jgi:hypothetical protein
LMSIAPPQASEARPRRRAHLFRLASSRCASLRACRCLLAQQP